jgi:hypothetical protein
LVITEVKKLGALDYFEEIIGQINDREGDDEAGEYHEYHHGSHLKILDQFHEPKFTAGAKLRIHFSILKENNY